MSIIGAILRRNRPKPGRMTQPIAPSMPDATMTPARISTDCAVPDASKVAFFSAEQCSLAYVAIIRAISSNLHLSDEMDYNEETHTLDMVSLSLKETPECAAYDEELLDYTLRTHISPEFLFTICNRPVSLHDTKPATVLF